MEKIHQLTGTVVGSLEYMAPEILKQKKIYNEKIDVFSMGCVFYKICCLKDYQKINYVLEEDKIINDLVQIEIPTNYDSDLMNIIKLMVELEPEKRPDSKTIMEK